MDADGSNRTRLTNSGPSALHADVGFPTWSPDGTRIAFNGSANFQDVLIHDIFVINADGSNLVNLTNSNQLIESIPAWSPDGTQIIFSGTVYPFVGAGADLYVMNAAGGAPPTNLTNTDGISESYPTWSPDGTQIAFEKSDDIYVMDFDGANPTQLTTHPARDGTPSWADSRDLQISELTHLRDDTRFLEVKYTITGSTLPDPFELGLYASDDGLYQTTDQQLGDLLVIGPETIDGTKVILAGEDPSRALDLGEHTLWIDVSGTNVETAGLADDAVKVVLAVLDPDNKLSETDVDPLNEDNTAAFRRIYKGTENRAVVRTGVGSADVVTITEQLQFTSEIDGTTKELTAPNLSTTGLGDVLVVTADGSDFISVERGVNTVLIGGTGGDTYAFADQPFAEHDLREDPGETLLDDLIDRDRISFIDFEGGAVQFDLSSTAVQAFSQTTIKLSDALAFEDLFGTQTFDDELTGNEGSNLIVGFGGHDTIGGEDGSDVLFGDGFLDLNLPETKDVLNGLLKLRVPLIKFTPSGNGNDVIDGGDETDVIVGGLGDDTIKGGDGGGIILGDAFEITASIGPGFSLKEFFKDPDKEKGSKGLVSRALKLKTAFKLVGAGNDEISGGSGIDVVWAGDGANVVDGGTGFADILMGGKDADFLDASVSTLAVLIGGEGDDHLNGSAIPGSLGSFILGDDFSDNAGLLSFGFDLDFIDGKFAKVSFKSGIVAQGAGKDTITAPGSFYNVIIAGDGDDTVTGGQFFNFIMGDTFNAGFDYTVDFVKAFRGEPFTKDFKLPGLAGSGQDAITVAGGVSIVIGGDGNDRVTASAGLIDLFFGNGGDDVLDGGPGFNALVGGAGNDLLIGGDDGNLMLGDTFDNPSGFFDIEAFKDSRFVAGLGLVPGENGEDTLLGGAGLDFLVGGDGSDHIEPGDGFNIVFGDAFSLGTALSIDLTQFENTDEAFDFFLPFTITGTGDEEIAGGAGVDFISGGGGDDFLTGGPGLDVLFGNDGDDVLEGDAGFNALVGGAGNDELEGGDDGNLLLGDTFSFLQLGTFRLSDLAAGRFLVEAGLVPNGSGSDTLTGGDGTDFLLGGEGDDQLDGGDGFNVAFGDTLTVNAATVFDFISVFNPLNIPLLFTSPNAVLESLLPFALVGSGRDSFTGGNSFDFVLGGGGNDTLRGAGGFDFLVGGDGDDSVDGGSGPFNPLILDDGDIVFGGPGDDQLFGREGNDHLESEEGNDTFFGGTGNDRIFGGPGADELHGEDGDDKLFGEDGDDTLFGGPGVNLIDGGSGTTHAHILAPIGDQTVNAGSTLTFTAIATNPQGHALVYSLGAGVAMGASLDATTGVFTWTPTEAQAPGTYTFKVRVTDESSGEIFDEETFTVQVLAENFAPITVQSIRINNGSAQWPWVARITVTFSGIVALQQGAFRLTKCGRKAVRLTVATRIVDGRTVAILKFRGLGILVDGRYTLTIVADKVRGPGHQPLDGDGDGEAGGNRVQTFRRLFRRTVTATAMWTSMTYGGSSARSAAGGATQTSGRTWTSTAMIGWVSLTCSRSPAGSAGA